MKKMKKLFLTTTMSLLILSGLNLTNEPVSVLAADKELTTKQISEERKNAKLYNVAESYTNIDYFYKEYAKNYTGVSVALDKNVLSTSKKVIIGIDLNKVKDNFNKNLPKDNPVALIIYSLKEDTVYYEALKELATDGKAYIHQEINVKDNNFEIKTTLSVGNMSTDTEYDTVTRLKYANNTNINFSDTKTHWAKADINAITQKGIANGYGNGKFGPEDKITRGQFAAMLARTIPNADLQDIKSPFTDISNSSFLKDIALLNQLGIVSGTSATTFSPDAYITREQAVTMLVRYLNTLNVDTSKVPTSVSQYNDSKSISSFARDSVGKMSNLKVIQGSDNKFNPQGYLTRSQMAKILNGALEMKIGQIEK